VPDIRLTEAAIADLAEIDAFGGERFGDDAADAYQRGIAKVFARLESFPLSGELRPGYGTDIRCVIHRSHRILYKVEADSIIVARILHHSRDVQKHLKP
jgi:toxin ParE1/3/4